MAALASGSVTRQTALAGVWLFAVGLVTGLWSAAALTETVKVAMPRLALIAHLNALLGGMWLIVVAYTFSFMGYQEHQKRRLMYAIAVPAWGNWLITLLASFLGVNGLAYNANPTNNSIAFLLQSVVVVPSLIAAAFWIRGFYYKDKSNEQQRDPTQDHLQLHRSGNG
jgi:hydroxylaminobenzene mutase